MKKLGLVAFAPTLAALAFMAPACGDPAPPTATGGTTSQGGSGQGGAQTTSGGSTQGGMTTTQGGSTTTSGGSTTMGGSTTTMGGSTTTMGGSTSGGAGGMSGANSGGNPTNSGGNPNTSGGNPNTSGGAATSGGAGGGGSTSKGGSTGTGGTTGGASTTGGATATGGSGGATDLSTVAKVIDGAMLLGPCVAPTGEQSVCLTQKSGCPPAVSGDTALSGVLTTDKTVTLGGQSGKMYTITLHIQGEVEAKEYNGGSGDIVDSAVSSKMNGWHVGGTPTGGNAYNVYMIRVVPPGGDAKTAKSDYFLNDLIGPGVSDHTTYLIDYMASFKAQGGSSVRLIAADSNCSMIKNCGPVKDSGGRCLTPLKIDSPDPKAVSLNPSFKFDTPYDGQWVVMTVVSVTEG